MSFNASACSIINFFSNVRCRNVSLEHPKETRIRKLDLALYRKSAGTRMISISMPCDMDDDPSGLLYNILLHRVQYHLSVHGGRN